MRDAIATGHADYVPIFLSDIPHLIRRGGQRVDTAIIQVSPPDAHGYCSLGLSVDIARAAIQCADTIIAQVCGRDCFGWGFGAGEGKGRV